MAYSISFGVVFVVAGQFTFDPYIPGDRERVMKEINAFQTAKREQLDRQRVMVASGAMAENAIGGPNDRYNIGTVYKFDKALGIPVVNNAVGKTAFVKVPSVVHGNHQSKPGSNSHYDEYIVILKNIDIRHLDKGVANAGLLKTGFVYVGPAKINGVSYPSFEVAKGKK